LIVWITGTPHAVLKTTHSSGCMGIDTTPITVASQCFTGYKCSFGLALISI
jgi:hypothetical protein